MRFIFLILLLCLATSVEAQTISQLPQATTLTGSELIAVVQNGITSRTTINNVSVGGVLGIANGGTGLSAIPTAGQILIGNGLGYNLTTLTAGSNITITNTPGNITISATGGGGGGGVSSVSNSDGSLTVTSTTTNAVVSLNVNNPNTWTALQTVTSGDFALTSTTTGVGIFNGSGILSGVATLANSFLTNSSITLGTTAMSLGSSYTNILGLASLSWGPSLTTGSVLDMSSQVTSMILPTGNSVQRPTATTGMLRYNSSTPAVEAYYNNVWNSLLNTTSGVTTFSAGTTGLTPSSATSGAVTLSGTLNVANGGTGAASLTNLGVIYGGGTGALSATSTVANAALITSSTGVPSESQTLPIAVQQNITALGAVTTGSLSLSGTSTFGTIVVSSCSGCGSGSSNLGTSTAATSPSITGDPTSGFYTPGTSQVAVSAGGTQIEKWAPTTITLNEPTTIGASLTLSANNFITDTTTGTEIGTAAGQKLGFFGTTPVAQQTGDVVTALGNLGLDTSGTVALSTNATNIGITDDNSTNAAMNLVWVTSNTGNLPAKTSSNVLNFNPSSGALTITSGNAKTSFTSAGVTSGTSFAASATSGLALDATTVTTGTAVSATGLTSGIGLGITGGATAIGYQFTSNNATSSTTKAINIVGTQSMTADYTGEYVICAPIKTMTPAATRNLAGTGLCFFSNPSYTITGSAASIMNVSGASNAFTRVVSNTSTSASSSLNLSGPVATFTNPSPTRTHPVVDTATVVTITQSDASATGNVLDVQNSGTGPTAAFEQAPVVIGAATATAGVSLDLGSTTNSMLLPVGTTGNRPTGVAGMLRYNSTIPALEAYYNSAWQTINSTIICGGSGSTAIVANATDFFWTSGSFTAAVLGGGAGTIPLSGTFRNLYVNSNTTAGTGNTTTLTLYVNGSSTAVTCAISGGSSQACNDTTHSVTISAAQTAAIQDVQSLTASANVFSFCIELDH